MTRAVRGRFAIPPSFEPWSLEGHVGLQQYPTPWAGAGAAQFDAALLAVAERLFVDRGARAEVRG